VFCVASWDRDVSPEHRVPSAVCLCGGKYNMAGQF